VVARIVIILAFVGLLVTPFALRPARPDAPAAARRVIIITPHNEQIRTEFGRAFDAWHREHHGEPAEVVWNVPGGTSEIRKMLEAQYTAALEQGREPGGTADLLFGGGSYEHGRLKGGVTVVVNGVERHEPISQPLHIAGLDEIYEQEAIGPARLYDADGYWFGTALSGFGIVYNRDALDTLDVPPPRGWEALCDARLQGWVALVNPGQSGSITTAFESILRHKGWPRGWAILRRAGANARYFSGSSLKPPTDVSAGNAAMGVCIDFYGRFQSQAIKVAGGGDRLGYVDPPGASSIDPDPISMLRGAPNPEMAERFVTFTLTEEAQALWQFPVRGDDAVDRLGPERFELRRLVIRPSMYERYADRMIDDVNPYAIVADEIEPDRNMRSFIAVVFSAMVMDTHHELKAAWAAITSHAAYPRDRAIATAADVTDPTLQRMLELFDAMPEVAAPGGAMRLDTTAELGPIKQGWLRGDWAHEGLWPPDANPNDVLRRRLADAFRANYRQIVELAEGGG
jgi:ABC-type Fe3+ transport system substrate-binding protein